MATLEALPLINLSAGGALVEAPWPLETESVHSIKLQSGAAVQDAVARVRHLRPIWKSGQQHYLVGLEFVVTPDTTPNDANH